MRIGARAKGAKKERPKGWFSDRIGSGYPRRSGGSGGRVLASRHCAPCVSRSRASFALRSALQTVPSSSASNFSRMFHVKHPFRVAASPPSPLRSHSPVPSFGYAIMTRASKRRKQPRRKRASEARAVKTGRSIASARRAEKRRRGRGRRRGVVAGCRCAAALLGCVREGVLRRDAAEYQAFGHVAAAFVVVAPDGTELAG